MTASTKDPIEASSVHFQLERWYEGLLREARVTFQVLEFHAGPRMRIQVFRTFHAGKMLTTEERVKMKDLASCRGVPEPQDSGCW